MDNKFPTGAVIAICLAVVLCVGSLAGMGAWMYYQSTHRQTVQMQECVKTGHQWVPTNSGNGATYQCIK